MYTRKLPIGQFLGQQEGASPAQPANKDVPQTTLEFSLPNYYHDRCAAYSLLWPIMRGHTRHYLMEYHLTCFCQQSASPSCSLPSSHWVIAHRHYYDDDGYDALT